VATRYDPPDGQADLLGTYDRLTSGLGGSIPLIASARVAICSQTTRIDCFTSPLSASLPASAWW
jgi:hypothetical protein